MTLLDQVKQLNQDSLKIALSDPNEGYALAEKAFQMATENGFLVEKGLALYHKSYACRVMSQYSEALVCAFDAYELLIAENHEEGVIKTLNMLGIIYFYYGSYEDAIYNFNEALKLIESHHVPTLKASIYNNIGEIYREAHDYKSALDHYELALEISNKNNLKRHSAVIYINIANIQFLTDSSVDIYPNLIKAKQLAIEENDVLNQGEAENYLGRYHLNNKDYQRAREYFLSSFEKYNSVNNKYYLVDLLMEMSNLDMALNNSPINNLFEALNISIENKLDLKTNLLYQKIAEYYETAQNYKESLKYYKLHHMIEKEIEASNLTKRLEILSIELNESLKNEEYHQYININKKLKRDIEVSTNALQQLKDANAKLRHENVQDQLTQLYNRRGIDSKFKELILTHHHEHSVVYIVDIDNFKSYNDYWGHIQGDVCLTVIAGALKDAVADRFGDLGFAGRYGGEEFLIYISDIETDEAIAFGQDLLTTIISKGILYTNTETSKAVSISIGASFGYFSLNTLNQHIANADRKLYDAKDKGRNRLEINL